MQAWLDSLAPGYGQTLMWTVLALVGLLILLVLVRIVRGLTFGTFVAGGRNRKARLAVMDATAVDSQRRLVLVRRDDVEHLILIGGPTDVVVEQNIRLVPAVRRSAGEEHAPTEQPRQPPAEPAARPVAAQRPVHVPPARPQPTAPRAAAAAPPVNAAPPSPPPVPPQREPSFVAPTPALSPAPQTASVQTLRPVTAASAAQPAKLDLDDALLEELEVTLDKEHKPAPAPEPEQNAAERSLDDEMSRLLSDLSGPKR